MPAVILAALGLAALIWYIQEKIKARSVKAVLIKSVVSALFLAVAVYGWFSAAKRGVVSLMGAFVVMGLVFGLLGDLWLDFKFIYPQHDAPYTYIGMAAFGVGHLLYITALLLRYYPQGEPLAVLLPIMAAILVSAGNLLLEKPMKLQYGKLKPVVFTYGVLLFSVIALSGSLAIRYGWRETTLNLFFAGSILFAVSDVILSGTYWGQGKDRPVDLALNYLTYYPAQYLIAASLLFMTNR